MLARTLGKTVGELLRETSSAEIAEWQAFFRLEARGRERPESDPKVVENGLRAIFGRPNGG